MKSISLLAIAAIAASAALPSFADEADGSDRALVFKSVRSAASVRAEAVNAPRITNGGTGYSGLAQSSQTAEAVRAEAIRSARAGELSRGESAPM